MTSRSAEERGRALDLIEQRYRRVVGRVAVHVLPYGVALPRTTTVGCGRQVELPPAGELVPKELRVRVAVKCGMARIGPVSHTFLRFLTK